MYISDLGALSTHFMYLELTQIAFFGCPLPPHHPSESMSIVDGPGRDLAKRNKVNVGKSQNLFSFLSPIQNITMSQKMSVLQNLLA